MTRHTASTGTMTEYEEGTAYDLTLSALQLKEGEYKGEPTLQLLFVFTCDAIKDKDECWVFASFKFGKYQGRVSKMREIVNALYEKPPFNEVEWVDDDDFTVKFADEDNVFTLTPGLTLKAKGEYYENNKGETRFRFTRFASSKTGFVAPKPTKKKGDEEKVDPADIPF